MVYASQNMKENVEKVHKQVSSFAHVRRWSVCSSEHKKLHSKYLRSWTIGLRSWTMGTILRTIVHFDSKKHPSFVLTKIVVNLWWSVCGSEHKKLHSNTFGCA
jgi:hypothetical protein